MKKLSLLVLLLVVIVNFWAAEPVKAVWATVWDIDTPAKLDTLFADSAELGFNTVLLQVRYRSDTLYTPNKYDSLYINNEPRSHVLDDKLYDPLAHALTLANQYNLKVVAWVTVFVATTNILENLAPDHPYFEHPDWVTTDATGQPMQLNEYEGLFFDPALPQVQNHITAVLCDLIQNYPVDGLQLDYVRYPSPAYGYHPQAVELFKKSGESDFNNFRRDAITGFVTGLRKRLNQIRPGLELSVAAVADSAHAKKYYMQDWPLWLKTGLIDKIYLMAYNRDDDKLAASLAGYDLASQNIIVGLRAWAGGKAYPVQQLISKLNLVAKQGGQGFALFNYGGLVKNQYRHALKEWCHKNLQR